MKKHMKKKNKHKHNVGFIFSFTQEKADEFMNEYYKSIDKNANFMCSQQGLWNPSDLYDFIAQNNLKTLFISNSTLFCCDCGDDEIMPFEINLPCLCYIGDELNCKIYKVIPTGNRK